MKSYTKADQTKKTKKPRKKKCPECKEWFIPKREFQKVCGDIKCAIAHGKKTLKQTQNKAKKDLNQNTTSYLKKKAQGYFNRFIRLRDADLPCISCGHNGDRQFHAGHFRPTGRNQALRFNEDNCHKQCSICNNHLSGNLVPYRKNLIKKIGIERVEKLESTNGTKSYTVEELKEVITEYRIKIKKLNQGA